MVCSFLNSTLHKWQILNANLKQKNVAGNTCISVFFLKKRLRNVRLCFFFVVWRIFRRNCRFEINFLLGPGEMICCGVLNKPTNEKYSFFKSLISLKMEIRTNTFYNLVQFWIHAAQHTWHRMYANLKQSDSCITCNTLYFFF